MYAEIDRELEMEAFREMLEKLPRVLGSLSEHLATDPCIDEVREVVRGLARDIGARLVFVFGSLARKGCGEDVDLAIKLERRPRSMLSVGKVQAILEDSLGARVDLVILNSRVPPALAKTIVDEAVLIYGDREEAESEILRLYRTYLEAQEILSIAVDRRTHETIARGGRR